MTSSSCASDWSPFEEDHSREQIAWLVEFLEDRKRVDGRHSSIVDLGCGNGRTLVPLARAGHELIGVDRDPSAITALRHRLKEAGLDALLIERDFESALAEITVPVDVVLCLGNTLMEVVALGDLERLFKAIRSRLGPDGALIIDDFPYELWSEVTGGAWQSGVSEDGHQQMVFQPGGPIFVLREGDAVDESSDLPAKGERHFRLWSVDELEFVGVRTGLPTPRHEPAAHVIVFSRRVQRPGR